MLNKSNIFIMFSIRKILHIFLTSWYDQYLFDRWTLIYNITNRNWVRKYVLKNLYVLIYILSIHTQDQFLEQSFLRSEERISPLKECHRLQNTVYIFVSNSLPTSCVLISFRGAGFLSGCFLAGLTVPSYLTAPFDLFARDARCEITSVTTFCIRIRAFCARTIMKKRRKWKLDPAPSYLTLAPPLCGATSRNLTSFAFRNTIVCLQELLRTDKLP